MRGCRLACLFDRVRTLHSATCRCVRSSYSTPVTECTASTCHAHPCSLQSFSNHSLRPMLRGCVCSVRPDALEQAAATLQASHPEVIVAGLQCDVTNRVSVEELLRAVGDRFDGAPVVYLGANAGVLFPSSTVLTGSADEWNLTLQVNVIGVVNTLQTFVPAMIAHERDCCVVTTASIAGLVTGISGPVRVH